MPNLLIKVSLKVYNGDDVIYKLRDICRYLPGRIIEYIGKSDKQVKRP